MVLYILICISGFIAALLCSVIWFKNRNLIESAVMGTVLWISSHIFSSIGLFVINRYTILRAGFLTMLADAVLLAIVILVRKEKPFSVKSLFKCDLSIKDMLIPILVCVAALPFTAKNNELFGMGQDEGVYQTQAISFISGNTKRQKDFAEYYVLEEQSDKDVFEENVKNHLRGWDIGKDDYPDTVYERNVSSVSGIYHGIPAYTALLAMWGKIFGIEDMADINMIFYVCMIFLVYFVCRNLKLKKIGAFCACASAAFAPVVIWVAKSSLTEMFLAVLPLTFLYFMTDDENPQNKWLSIVPVAVYSCYHVSIYTVIPLFFVIYAAMYFFTREKQYAVLMPLTLAGYLLSYYTMRHIQPFYTMNNYSTVFVGGINVYNITLFVTLAVVLGLAATGVYILVVKKTTPKSFKASELLAKANSSKVFGIMLKLMIILPVLYIVGKGIARSQSWTDFSFLTLIGFIANGGLVLVTLGIIISAISTKNFSKNTSRLVVLVMFFYMVLFYSAFLRFDIQYYFYYSRYLAPFISVAIIFSVTALDNIGGKLICPAAALGLIYVMPYDTYLLSHKDDTRMEWSVLDDLTDYIHEGDCLVMSGYAKDLLWLPLKNISDADAVYPENASNEKQFMELGQRYGRVLLITFEPQNTNIFSLVYTNKVKHSEDALNYQSDFVPMPEKFWTTEDTLYVYSYDEYKYRYTAKSDYDRLDGVSALESTFCWTDSEESKLVCLLYPDTYVMTINFACGIPLSALDDGIEDMSICIDGKEVATAQITEENNGQPLRFEIDEKYLEDGENVVTIRSELWEASSINPQDTRILGIPIESIMFEPV